jgi:hypothetical protein
LLDRSRSASTLASGIRGGVANADHSGVDDAPYPPLRGWRVAVLVAAMAACAGFVAAREGGNGREVALGMLAATLCGYAGTRTLGPTMSLPMDRHRFRCVLAYTLIIGGPLLAAGIPHEHETGMLGSLVVTAVIGLALFGFIWLLVARPHRGLFGRFLALRGGGLRCPACGRMTAMKSRRCMYCDSELPSLP